MKIGDLTATVPIVQGGMGVGVSLSGLASAVANEGGVGVISSAGLGVIYRDYSHDYDEASIYGLGEELAKARKLTKGIIGVNVMVAMSNFADMVRTAVARKADIIFSGAGLPLTLPSFLKSDSTTKLAPIVSSARALKVLCRRWIEEYGYVPDAVVVEGPKAGGHLGYSAQQLDDAGCTLEHILPEVVAEARETEQRTGKHIPVIAGGGIYTGEDIYDITALGAEGVQMGTRFVTTEECDAPLAYKEAYIQAKKEDIVIIKSPVGMPGRAIYNPFMAQVAAGNRPPIPKCYRCLEHCDIAKIPYCITQALVNAAEGDEDHALLFCGSNAYRAEGISTVAAVMDALINGEK